MHDPGDESDARERVTTAPEVYLDTQPERVPDGGDPHVGEGGDPVFLDAGKAAAYFEEQADMLHLRAHQLRLQRDELRRKDAKWTVEARRNWQGRLRRMGHEIDMELGRGMP